MNLAEEAFQELYPDIKQPDRMILKYTRKLKGYNGNIRSQQGKTVIEVHLAKDWQAVSPEIQKGIIEHLLARLFKIKKAKTGSMELYESFLKNLSKFAVVSKQEPLLLAAFLELNEEYFESHLDTPNLVFGNPSFSLLGTYTYASDTITLSNIFRDVDGEDALLLKYVLYHEMLHKQEQFTTKNGRMHSHTKKFREREREFKLANPEERLRQFLRRKKRSFSRSSRSTSGKKSLLEWLFD